MALVGVVALSLSERRLHRIVGSLLSFAAGTLFGDAILQRIPELTEAFGFTSVTGLSKLAGILLAVVVEKFIAGSDLLLELAAEMDVRRTLLRMATFLLGLGAMCRFTVVG